MNVLDFKKMKQEGRKISMVTCYDYGFARILNHSQVDCLLVGDSVAMVQHGYSSTLPATPELMAAHVAAVVREGRRFAAAHLGDVRLIDNVPIPLLDVISRSPKSCLVSQVQSLATKPVR